MSDTELEPDTKPPILAWERTFGGEGSDMGMDAKPTPDGGYIITGATKSIGAGSMDVWLIKTDAEGNKIWDKTFGGGDWDVGMSVIPTADGGYVVGGYTNSFGSGGTNMWLIKTDAEGNKIWDKTFGGTSMAINFTMIAVPDGGYILTGGTSINFSETSDALAVKTDSEGNEQWSQVYGGLDYDHIWTTNTTPDGGYIFIGGTDSFGHGDVWLIKTDGNGNMIWHNSFEGEGDDTGFSAQETEDGGYLVTAIGYCGAGMQDFWLIKTDAEGNKIWDKTFGGADEDILAAAQPTPDGGCIMAGHTSSFGAGGKDAWLVRTDADGNKLWDETFGGAGDDYVNSIALTSDGGYIIMGYTKDTADGEYDFWLVKLSRQN